MKKIEVIQENCFKCNSNIFINTIDQKSIPMIESEGNVMHPICEGCYDKIKERSKPLTFDEYQSLAQATAIYPGQGEPLGKLYTILGLCGEAGEVAEVASNFLDESIERHSLLLVSYSCRISALLSKAIRDNDGNVNETQIQEICWLLEEIGKISKINKNISKILKNKTIIKKLSNIDSEEMKKEFGDCLWFGAQMMKEFGLSMSSSAVKNINKLKSRKNRGVLNGEGGDR